MTKLVITHNNRRMSHDRFIQRFEKFLVRYNGDEGAAKTAKIMLGKYLINYEV